METFQLPPRKSLSEFLNQEALGLSKGKNGFPKTEPKTPRKGKSWTNEEHLAFLAGLKKFGKGNWRGIARYYVPSRTSTQIASHAQKYLQRISGSTKRRSKFADIEQQAESLELTDEFQHTWSASGDQMASAEEQPSAHTSSEGSDSQQVPQLQTQTSGEVSVVCKPTALRASSSETDLLKLAESLISLREAGSSLSPSKSSAFKRGKVLKAR